jgi:Dickkopf N-terminal cysteine-rich region
MNVRLARRRWRVLVCIGIFTASAHACGESDRVPFSQRLRAAFCGFAVRCGLAPDLASCEEEPEFRQSLAEIDALIESGRVRYDKVQAGLCFQRLASAACVVDGLDVPELAVCEAALQGTVGPGDVCELTAECAGPAPCDRSACSGVLACCAGVCGKARPRRSSGPCEQDSDCTRDRYCAQPSNSPSGTCQLRVPAGQACLASGSCQYGSSCFYDDNFRHLCSRHPSQGEKCNNDVCNSLSDWCDSADDRCKPRVSVGQPCTDDGFDPAGSCRRYLVCASGTCQVPPALGEPCTPTGTFPPFTTPPCASGTCIDGLCRERPQPVCDGSVESDAGPAVDGGADGGPPTSD